MENRWTLLLSLRRASNGRGHLQHFETFELGMPDGQRASVLDFAVCDGRDDYLVPPRLNATSVPTSCRSGY